MSNFSAPVVEFTIEKHPNADLLSIAHVEGWQCIVKTADFKNETLGVYVPLDAVADKDHPLLDFMNGKKVKTIKLRKVISQGILLPLSTVEKFVRSKGYQETLQVGDDLHTLLELKKWEPVFKPQGLNVSGGSEAYLESPGWMGKYTDIENWNNHPNTIKEGEIVSITEKLHGSSARYGIVDGEFYVGSRNRILRLDPYISRMDQRKWDSRPFFQRFKDFILRKKVKLTTPRETVWTKIARKQGIRSKLRYLSFNFAEGGNVAIYGEIVGPGVQDLEYGLEEVDLYLYDIRIEGRSGDKYISPPEFREMAGNIKLKTVPLLKEGPFELADLELRKGKDTINTKHVREGIVIEPTKLQFDKGLGRVILKRVSENYLLRKNGTDY